MMMFSLNLIIVNICRLHWDYILSNAYNSNSIHNSLYKKCFLLVCVTKHNNLCNINVIWYLVIFKKIQHSFRVMKFPGL